MPCLHFNIQAASFFPFFVCYFHHSIIVYIGSLPQMFKVQIIQDHIWGNIFFSLFTE